MNRDTRTFIYGFFAIGIGVLSLSGTEIMDGNYGFYELVQFALGLICLWIGFSKISKTTD